MKPGLLFAALVMAALVFLGGFARQAPVRPLPADWPEAGLRRGHGGAPTYHRPEDWWRANHRRLVAGNGTDRPRPLTVRECLVCHRPEGSCRSCHAFVGATGVVIREEAP